MFQTRRPELPARLCGIASEEPGDQEVEAALRFVAARARPPRPRRIELPPLPGSRELGPPCPVCALTLDRSAPLVACVRCLAASHPRCWPTSERCACERPRPGGRGLRPR
ncbi:MAG: hypothetical protein AB7N76_06270 [Planctomycetota bacterium]